MNFFLIMQIVLKGCLIEKSLLSIKHYYNGYQTLLKRIEMFRFEISINIYTIWLHMSAKVIL